MKNVEKSPAKSAGLARSPCPVANVLDILGDKWTLLVIRDLWMGKQTYSELQNSPETIPSNILAERLKRLLTAGIIEKTPYQQNPIRYAYALTTKGAELEAVLYSMVKWANKYIPGTVPERQIRTMLKSGRQQKARKG